MNPPTMVERAFQGVCLGSFYSTENDYKVWEGCKQTVCKNGVLYIGSIQMV